MRNWFLLLISVAALAQAAPPARVEIDYEVTRNGMALADIEHRFEHTGGAYQLTETWRGRGLFYLRGKIRRESRVAITAHGLQPLEYSDKRTGRDTERATFDWNAKTVTVQYQGDPKTLPLPPHPHDRLAFFYQFAFVPPQAGQVARFSSRTAAHRRKGRHAPRPGRHPNFVSVRVTRALLVQASAALSSLIELSRPADEALSLFFRGRRSLGQHDRAFIAETAFAALRRRRSLEAAAGSAAPDALLAAALLRIIGLSGRALEGLVDEKLVARIRAAGAESFPAAVRADLPDWLWDRLVAGRGDAEAMRIAQGMLNAAPLDLRVNVARVTRDAVLARLGEDEIAASTTPYSPAGIRLSGKPPVNRHPLFRDGLIEVQDEGSQLLAWLLAP